MKKYIVYGGYVISKNDGDRHYISAFTVGRLYKVSPTECIFVDTNRDDRYKLLGVNTDNYKALVPREDGMYNLY